MKKNLSSSPVLLNVLSSLPVSLTTKWETRMQFMVPGFSVGQTQLLGGFSGNNQQIGKSLSVSLILDLQQNK